jgi:hypothetical protein
VHRLYFPSGNLDVNIVKKSEKVKLLEIGAIFADLVHALGVSRRAVAGLQDSEFEATAKTRGV